jgi:hypothetical protein
MMGARSTRAAGAGGAGYLEVASRKFSSRNSAESESDSIIRKITCDLIRLSELKTPRSCGARLPAWPSCYADYRQNRKGLCNAIYYDQTTALLPSDIV